MPKLPVTNDETTFVQHNFFYVPVLAFGKRAPFSSIYVYHGCDGAPEPSPQMLSNVGYVFVTSYAERVARGGWECAVSDPATLYSSSSKVYRPFLFRFTDQYGNTGYISRSTL